MSPARFCKLDLGPIFSSSWCSCDAVGEVNVYFRTAKYLRVKLCTQVHQCPSNAKSAKQQLKRADESRRCRIQMLACRPLQASNLQLLVTTPSLAMFRLTDGSNNYSPLTSPHDAIGGQERINNDIFERCNGPPSIHMCEKKKHLLQSFASCLLNMLRRLSVKGMPSASKQG